MLVERITWLAKVGHHMEVIKLLRDLYDQLHHSRRSQLGPEGVGGAGVERCAPHLGDLPPVDPIQDHELHLEAAIAAASRDLPHGCCALLAHHQIRELGVEDVGGLPHSAQVVEHRVDAHVVPEPGRAPDGVPLDPVRTQLLQRLRIAAGDGAPGVSDQDRIGVLGHARLSG